MILRVWTAVGCLAVIGLRDSDGSTGGGTMMSAAGGGQEVIEADAVVEVSAY